jgi:hypothetical protein
MSRVIYFPSTGTIEAADETVVLIDIPEDVEDTDEWLQCNWSDGVSLNFAEMGGTE